MKRFLSLILLACVALALPCGLEAKKRNSVSRNTGRRVVDLAGPSADFCLDIYVPFDVTVTRDGRPRIEMTGDENLLPKISVSRRGSTVTLSIDENMALMPREVDDFRIRVHMPDNFDHVRSSDGEDVGIVRIRSYSIGDVRIIDGLESEFVELASYGTGDITAPRADASQFKVMTGGTGDITVKEVYSNSVNVSSAGTGDVKMDNIEATHVDLNLLGVGDINVGEVNAVMVRFFNGGTGDLSLKKGKCESAQVTLTGLGDIQIPRLQSVRYTQVLTGAGSIRH